MECRIAQSSKTTLTGKIYGLDIESEYFSLIPDLNYYPFYS